MLELFKASPIPDEVVLQNLGLFINRQALTRMLFMHELYQKQLPVHGVIMEFGTLWGQNLALFESFRGIYEPYNHNRKIIGFDTFSGFPATHEKDGKSAVVAPGQFSVTENYEVYLEKILSYHETESPISHIKKFELVKGDASVTLEKYLKDNPETIISLAYLDFDIYEPTKKCLSLIKGHLTKGSVIGFDELNVHDYPGEMIAVKEELGLQTYRITRNMYSSVNSYIVIE
ncbi:crotonobetainyl-CoA--carnitine CoA-transferase [Patescibacteria group bacterium]|nr:crotonobetainyl-CoA--carnitine CoA-transferase [Patescibacteria group bacterium]